MVSVVLKGVHVVRAKLASGKTAEYHYAWKGGPRLKGAPGSPEYVCAYQDAHAARKKPQTGSLLDVLAVFRASAEFEQLSGHTQRAYRRHLDQIQSKFGDMPLKAVEDRRVRRLFYAWRDTMSATPRTADYAMGTLKRLLDFAEERGFIAQSPIERVRRLHRVDRSESIWTADDVAAFRKTASKELSWAVELGLLTGLRQSDLIRLTWGNFDAPSASFQARTSKTGKVVTIPATQACKALLKRIERRHLVILTTERGKRPWTADGLRSSFGKACEKAGVSRTFHDLRRTAATNLVAAGIPSTQVAMAMGWEEEAIESLKRRYVSRPAVVAAMLAMLEKGV